MPLKENRRAKQTGNQHLQNFVDSDFFDSHSVKRAQSIARSKKPKKLQSTSPLSSKASGFIKTHPNQRLSGLDGEVNSVAFQVRTTNSSYQGISD